MQQRTSAISVLDTSIIGHIKLTLTNWTNTFEPETAAGSSLEIGGSLFYATGNDDLDVAGAWGGIANSTLVYVYYGISGTNTTQELSITAPTWDTAKQGWYNAAMTKRCPVSIFKDAAGNYTQKTILINRTIGITHRGVNLGGNAAIKWSEAGDYFEFDKPVDNTKLNTRNDNNGGAGDTFLIAQSGPGSSAPFHILKPITARFTANSTTCAVYCWANKTWVLFFQGGAMTWSFPMNPGLFKLEIVTAGICSLYCVGVYGAPDYNVVADIMA